MTTPPTPWPVEYAIARVFLENKRTLESNRSRKRSQDFVGASGALRAVADIATKLGISGANGSKIHGYVMDVTKELPIDAGTDWLHAAAEKLAARLRDDD